MPTVLRNSGYRFFFYASDGSEPPHIHIEHELGIAKIWLDPVRLSSSSGFSRNELKRIQQLVKENHELLLRSWNDYFGD
jgi:hypothetical protein